MMNTLNNGGNWMEWRENLKKLNSKEIDEEGNKDIKKLGEWFLSKKKMREFYACFTFQIVSTKKRELNI